MRIHRKVLISVLTITMAMPLISWVHAEEIPTPPAVQNQWAAGWACAKFTPGSIERMDCDDCKSAPTSSLCAQKFACDSMFPDHKTATKCNYDRCMTTRSTDYCSCKYGKWWSWIWVWIPLNTDIPFVGRCLGKSDTSGTSEAALNAFPSLIGVISKMLVTVILLMGFVMIVVGGVQWSSGDAKSGRDKITKVAMWFALLGLMGAILRFINPNFFK